MKSNWRQSTWGDEVSLEYGKAIRGYREGSGQYRVFGSNGPIGWTTESLAPGPGVILGRKGAYRGVQYSQDPFFVIDTAYYVVPKTELDMRWLYYAIQYHKLGEIDDGSPVPSTTRAAVYVREVEIPPLNVQRRIAKILGSIDQKIELNRQTNQTLEHIAQAIFKSWFVDFEPTRAKIAAKQYWQALNDVVETSSPTCYSETDDTAKPNIQGLDEAMNQAAMAAISGLSRTDAAGAPLEELQQLSPEQLQYLQNIAALFPDTLVDSELGETNSSGTNLDSGIGGLKGGGMDSRRIPEGWEVKSLSEIIEVVGGGTPKRSEELYWNGDIPWFSVKDAPSLSDVFVLDTVEKITDLGLKKSSTKLLPVGATIITARGTVGKLALVGTPMCMNQSCYGIISVEGIGPYFNYFNLREAISTLQRNTHGAVFDTITTQTFESYSMPVCGGELLKIYEDFVAPLMDKIKANCAEIVSLGDTRDTLLPKLLSGEIIVAKPKSQLESV